MTREETIEKATNLLASAICESDKELQKIVDRFLEQGPERMNPYAVDLAHTLILRHTAYISGMYRLILLSYEDDDKISAFRRELDEHIDFVQSEMKHPIKRNHVSYLWNLTAAGFHHIILRRAGRPLFSGNVPTVESVVKEEKTTSTLTISKTKFDLSTVN